MCIDSQSPYQELAGMAGSMIFYSISDDDKKEMAFLFTIINTNNIYWHLVVVDLWCKQVIRLNSIKYNVKYKASARKWHKIFGAMFHIYCDNAEVMKWKMEKGDICPSQPNNFLNYGLYYLKYMNHLAC